MRLNETGSTTALFGCCLHIRDTFREQAGFLLAGGVDGFLIETMMDLREALCALSACLEVATLPVLVSLSFQITNNGGRTLRMKSILQIFER